MARYLVTSGSNFKPLSYDEIVKPLAQMTEAHTATQDAYDQLSLETNALRQYISDNPDDRQAKQMYEGYVDKLSTFQNNLYNNGYTAGTRRDLSAARSAYASDITRLQKAITDRQERSKEYWDTKHKNPDMVMGSDPGLSGLDNYLSDDNYGRDWYSYSGTQFMSEVGADAKARASEMLRDPEISRDPRLAGYLTQKVQEGFTSEEVANAGQVVQAALASGIRELPDGIPVAERILANVLLSHLESTGAQSKLSSDEFARLFNYGMAGLSQAIGKKDVNYMSDKVWDDAMQRSRIRYQHSLTQPKETPAQEGVHRELINRQVEEPGSGKTRERIGKWFDDKTYENGPITVNLPNGGSRQIGNADEARQLFTSPRVEKFFDATGIDLRTRASDFLNTTESKKMGDYKGVPIMIQETGGLFGNRGRLVVKKKVGDKWIKASDLTEMANLAKNEYDNTMTRLAAANPLLDISTIGATPDEEKKIYKQLGIPEGVPSYDLRTAAEAKARVGNYYGVPIASGPEDADLKQRIANTINAKYANAHDNKDWKTAEWGFYPVGKGNATVGEENAATDKNGGLGSVFTIDKEGSIDPKSIYSIYILPQDIKDGKVNVRFETSKGTFATSISTLGDDLGGAMNGVVSDVLESLLVPMSQTVQVLDRNDETGLGWEQLVARILYGYDMPQVSDNGRVRVATAAEVARDSRLQTQLLNGVTEYLLDAIAYGIDPNSLHPRQHVSYTSSKASGLIDNEE